MAFPKNSDGSASSKLKQSERNRIIIATQEKGVTGTCELCKNANWSVGENLVAPVSLLRTVDGLQIGLKGQIYPSAVLMCTKCGNTKMLNVGYLGLTDYFNNSENEDE